jgi:hypothetical protein
MKSKSLLQQWNHKRASFPRSSIIAHLNQNEKNFAPAPDAVVMRAYFIDLSQGSLLGHNLQHWLEADEQLRAERNRMLIHIFAAKNQLTLESVGQQGDGANAGKRRRQGQIQL